MEKPWELLTYSTFYILNHSINSENCDHIININTQKVNYILNIF